MPYGRLEAAKSHWWSNLQEFGEQVLRVRRKALRLTQQQMAKRIDVDQSRIARIEQGEKPKDVPTARAFIIAYGLDKIETENWLNLIFGIAPSESIPREDLEFADNLLNTIIAIRSSGSPYQAIQLANSLEHWFQQKEKHILREVSPQLLERHGRVLLEKANSYRDFLTKAEILPVTEAILTEAQAIATACENAELFGMVEHQLGSVHYIAQYYGEAVRHYETSLLTIKQPEERLAVLSGLALARACLRNEEQFQATVLCFNHLLTHGDFSNLPIVCDALQTLVRAQCLFQLEEAWKTLERLQNFCSLKDQRGQFAPIRDVQLAKAQMETIVQFEPWNISALEKIGEKGTSLATTYGFTRHATQIQAILKNTLE